MGDLSVVAPLGRYGNLSKSTCSRSVKCRCCGQSQAFLMVQPSTTRVTKVCASEGSEQQRRLTVSCSSASTSSSRSSSRRGMRLREGGKEGPKRNLRKASVRRLATDILLCARAHAFDSMQTKEADNLYDSHYGRSGGAHSLRDETSTFRQRDGHDNDSFSHWDGKTAALMSSGDESARPGAGGLETVRNAGDGSCHPSDERSPRSCRVSDSWSMVGASQDGGLGGESGVLEGQGVLGNGRSRIYSSSQSSLNIPGSELLKIEELKYSGDMREGDSSPQVLNLQRALFWLGHLPGLSLTGYFGPETTKALQEFHYSNGFSSPGVWGFHSQQLLWKQLYPETHQRLPDRDVPEKSQSKVKKIPGFDLSGSWKFVKNVSGKAIGDGILASASLQRRHSKTFREFVSSVSSPLPCGTVVSQRVGVSFLIVAIILIIVKVVHFCFGQVHGRPVRKRVMSWRNGVDLRRPRKEKQSSFNVKTGHHKSSEGRKILRHFGNHRRPQPTDKQESRMCNLLDRLVLFEGQVVRGDFLTNGKMRRSTRSDLVQANENTMVDASNSILQPNSLPVPSSRQVDQSRFDNEAKKISPGLDQYQKHEAAPARKVSVHSSSPVQSEKSIRLTGGDAVPARKVSVHSSSPVQSEKPIRLTGGDQQWSYSSPQPSWASWVRFFFSPFFLRNERLPFSERKPSRRVVVRSTTSSRAKSSSERGAPEDVGLHLRSSGFEKGLLAEDEAPGWQEDNELDLTKRVEELHRTLQSVEQTRVSAMRALAEEKMHNLELEVKIRRQKEAAAALEDEVRVLKDSHDALLASLKKKYSSSAAARAAAALLYQNWDPSDSGARV